MYNVSVLHGKEEKTSYTILNSAQPQDRESHVNVKIVRFLFISSYVGGNDRT